MDAELSIEMSEWYLRAGKQFDSPKMEFAENIVENAHEKNVLASKDGLRYGKEREKEAATRNANKSFGIVKKIRHLIQKSKRLYSSNEGDRQRWLIMLCPI